jgi:IS30 family transposase
MSSYRRLTRSDRYQIEKKLSSGKSVRQIADALGFHRSSIYREVRRGTIRKGCAGGTKKGEYSAREAHRRFISTFRDSRQGITYRGHKIKGWVEDQIRIKLSEGWSPEQISNRLELEKDFCVSTEGIYKFILSCKRRGEELHKFLRWYRRGRRRFKRRNRYWDLQHQRRKTIENRPEAANQRVEIGHWERDLMLGRRRSGAILTMVERKTQYTLLEKLQSTLAQETNGQSARMLKKSKLPCLSVTNDNGHEFGEFWDLEKELSAPIYFAHPLSPWERGTVENTIGLLRQFIPKGTDLNQVTQQDIKDLEKTINSRPRKTLGFKTPYEVVSGKNQKLIKQRKIESLAPEYYERLCQELEERNRVKELVALTG